MSEYLFRDLVIDSRTGLNPRKNFVLGNGDNYYITIKDIHDGQIFFSDKTDRVDNEAIALIKKRSRIKNGDVLFVSIGRIGETAIVRDKDDSWDVNESVFIFTLDTDIIDAEYFCHLMRSKTVQDRLQRDSSGSTFKSIKMKQLEKMSFEVPRIEDQRAVVRKLSKVAEQIAICDMIIKKMDLSIKARFVEMFGDPRSNPLGYEKKPLGNTCKVITGNTPSRKVPEYYGDYIEWIKTDNIVSGLLNPTKASEYLSEKGALEGRTVDENAVLMACIAGSVTSIGRVCVTDRRVAFNQQINAVVPEQYNILFLYILLQISKDYLVEDINMALKGILSKSKLEEKEFFVPPMKLQNEFAEFVEQVDKSKSVVQGILDKLTTLQASLMQEYFG